MGVWLLCCGFGKAQHQSAQLAHRSMSTLNSLPVQNLAVA
jgi:hypothetical protein